jgi:ribosomal protein S18 acetylase RimI-like enzyme
MIRKVSLKSDFAVLAKLLNDSFATVADDFGLTEENCPTNNAFITADRLKSQLSVDSEFYYHKDGDGITGFIAIEKSSRDAGTFHIEKVAVHPDSRHKNIGRELMRLAEERIGALGGNRITIGLIDSNARLKGWYRKQGYVEFETKSYEHLPFDVCIMEKMI